MENSCVLSKNVSYHVFSAQDKFHCIACSKYSIRTISFRILFACRKIWIITGFWSGKALFPLLALENKILPQRVKVKFICR